VELQSVNNTYKLVVKMIRNDLQHIQLDSQSQREPALQEQMLLNLIRKILKTSRHLEFGLAFAPNLRAIYHNVCASLDNRQYAGFSTAEEILFLQTNLLPGSGLSIALPPHRGYDSDHERVVGGSKVAIDSVRIWVL
jgi:hypothetical protein